MNISEVQKTVLWVLALTLALYFSGLLIVITPLPLIYLGLKYKNKNLILVTGIAALSIAVLVYSQAQWISDLYQSSPWSLWLFPVPFLQMQSFVQNPEAIFKAGLLYLTFFVGSAWCILQAYTSNRAGFFDSLIKSQAILYSFVAGVVFWMVYPHSTELVASYQAYLDGGGLQQIMDFLGKNQISYEELIEVKSTIPHMMNIFLQLLPFAIMLILSLLFVLNTVLTKRFFLMAYPWLAAFNFTEFKVPFKFVWVSISMMALLLITTLSGQQSVFGILVQNAFLGCCLVYFYQGLAVFVHFLNRKKVVGLARTLIFVSLIFFGQGAISMLLTFTFIESWFDLFTFWVMSMGQISFIILMTLGFAEVWLETRKPPELPKPSHAGTS